MLAEYAGVLILLLASILLTGGMLAAQRRFGPRRPFERDPESSEAEVEAEVEAEFEAELEAEVDAHLPVSPRRASAVKFYLVAVRLGSFGVAAVFFYPWAATLHETSTPGLVAMLLFALPLGVGVVAGWAKGALEW